MKINNKSVLSDAEIDRVVLERCGEHADADNLFTLSHGDIARLLIYQPAQAVGAETVGIASYMPGTNGFTMACFEASLVPVGTMLGVISPVPTVKGERTNVGDDGLSDQDRKAMRNDLEEAVRAGALTDDTEVPIWGSSTLGDLCGALDGAHELSGPPHERIYELIRQRDEARAKSQQEGIPGILNDFEAGFSLIFEAYNIPADRFCSNTEWAIWQHGKVNKAFTHLQKVRRSLSVIAPVPAKRISTWSDSDKERLGEVLLQIFPDRFASPEPIHASDALKRCLICSEEEPHTGTCGSNDTRALCNQGLSDTNQIPSGIYYVKEHDNFYDRNGYGQGMSFYEKWEHRKDDFPNKLEDE